MKFLAVVFLFLSFHINAQSSYLVPCILSKTVYADYPTRLSFFCDSCAMNYQFSVWNGTIIQIDSSFYLQPNEHVFKCIVQVIDKKKRRSLGTYNLDVIPLPEPTVFIDSIVSGNQLSYSPSAVSVGIIGINQGEIVQFKLLSFQLFIEGFTPAWVTAGEFIEEKERNQIAEKQKDGKQTKVNVICQFIDHKNRIRNIGGWFYV
ncbi:MAG: hypothetical protein E6Q38_04775 [Crocinitomicaceae bacterium]|nr:MAG: hypothetical protein E6Q38_04775 [Crocinitomicaceae bacterium]